ncbi:MAG: hypothetical protein ISQ46_05510, partial [Methylophilaceae bacterium]|nr:hypothetical protein [Methylophilaceae bacterium]
MEDDAYFLFKISWCFILLLPTTIYHFFVVLSGDAKETIWVYCSYGYSLILLVIHILTNKVIAGVYIYPWGFYPKSGLFEILHIMQTFIVVSRGLYLGYVSLKKESSHQKKLQIKYCLFGFFIYLFASLDYLTNYGIIILESPPGFIFVAISLTIISYVIVRHDLLSIGAFFSVVLSKIIIYLLFLFIFLIGSVFVTGDYL